MQLKKIFEYYDKYVNPIEKKMICNFSYSKDIFLKAKGVYMFTDKGKKILDITGGVGVLNLGHNHPEILKERINFQKNFYLEVHKNILSRHVAKLSKKISTVLPKELTMSYFCNSGAEANDGAIKTAYKYHEGKREVILFSDIGFHGRLIGTMSVTADFKHKNFPRYLKAKDFKVNNINSIKKIIKNNVRKLGHPNIFAIILEPYNHTQTLACDYSFLKEIRRLCNKYNIILIYDEIYTGWCKTGSLFYFMRYKGICPDILTTSKSLGGGKASIAAYVMKSKIFKKCYENFSDYLLNTTTFNGFGEECVTTIKAIEILQNKKYCQFAKNIEETVNERFKVLSKKYPEYQMALRGCGALHKIYFKNYNFVQKFIGKKLTLKEKKMISKIKGVILEASILDELYVNFNIWGFQSLSKIVISPSLIIKSNEINYFFDSLEKILKQGSKKIIRKYINRLTK